MREYKFETYDRMTLRGRRWFFRFRAANGEIMLQSEGYNSAAARDHAIIVIRGKASIGRTVAVQS